MDLVNHTVVQPRDCFLQALPVDDPVPWPPGGAGIVGVLNPVLPDFGHLQGSQAGEEAGQCHRQGARRGRPSRGRVRGAIQGTGRATARRGQQDRTTGQGTVRMPHSVR